MGEEIICGSGGSAAEAYITGIYVNIENESHINKDYRADVLNVTLQWGHTLMMIVQMFSYILS